MRLAIYSNAGQHSKNVVAAIKEELITQAVGRIKFDQENPEVVLSVGGDGTLLSAFHYYSSRLGEIRFIGVHTGHLGFYADWQHFELKELVQSLLADEGRTVTYPLLEMIIHYRDGHDVKKLALNEAAIKRPIGTLVSDIYIDGELFERFRGDGLTASTPTGSTAYNKAIGGAVLHPSLEAIQLAEIASINNRVFRTLGSPLIIGSNEIIRIKPLNKIGEYYTISYDNLSLEATDIDSIDVRIAKERIAFAEYRHLRFWHRVQSSFIGPEVN